MTEQTLYTGLLKGAIIGTLPYANSLAETYANMIENGRINYENKPNIFSELILYYGDMLEEEEERDLSVLLKSTNKQALTERLNNLERDYREYFLELISERREKVEIVYQDLTQREKIIIEDEEIKSIKKAESLADANSAGNILKKIARNENEAIMHLHQETFAKINHHIIQNSGTGDDAGDIWSKSSIEFRKKLDKRPREKGYYEWRPAKSKALNNASIYTFFLGICIRRWLDELKKRKVEINPKNSDLLIELSKENSETEEFYEQEYLKFKIRIAIQKLGETCQKIINGRWFGGPFGEGLSSKELATETGLSEGYINNKHKSCLEQLREILTNDEPLSTVNT